MHALRPALIRLVLTSILVSVLLILAVVTSATWAYAPRWPLLGRLVSLGEQQRSRQTSFVAPLQNGPTALLIPLIFGSDVPPGTAKPYSLVMTPFFTSDDPNTGARITSIRQGGAFPSYRSSVFVQNLSATSSADVTVTYVDANGTVFTPPSQMVAPNGSFFHDENSAALPPGFIGSAVVASDQPLAAVSLVRDPESGGADVYNGRMAEASPFYLPIVTRNVLGRNSIIALQSSQASAAQITYGPSPALCQENLQLFADRSTVQDLQASTLSCLMHGDLNARLNIEQGVGAASAIGYSDNNLAAYAAIPMAESAPVLVAPLINATTVFSTSISIQNVSSMDASVTVELTPSTVGLPCMIDITLAGGASRQLNMHSVTAAKPDCGAQQGWAGSAVVYSDGGLWKESSDLSAGFPPLVAVVSVARLAGGMAAYPMMDRNGTTGNVTLPYLPFGHHDFISDIYVMNVSKKPQQVTCTAHGNNTTLTLDSLSPSGVAIFSFRPGASAGLSVNHDFGAGFGPAYMPRPVGVGGLGVESVDEEDDGDCESCKECEDTSTAGAHAVTQGRLAAVVLGMNENEIFLYSGKNFEK